MTQPKIPTGGQQTPAFITDLQAGPSSNRTAEHPLESAPQSAQHSTRWKSASSDLDGLHAESTHTSREQLPVQSPNDRFNFDFSDERALISSHSERSDGLSTDHMHHRSTRWKSGAYDGANPSQTRQRDTSMESIDFAPHARFTFELPNERELIASHGHEIAKTLQASTRNTSFRNHHEHATGPSELGKTMSELSKAEIEFFSFRSDNIHELHPHDHPSFGSQPSFLDSLHHRGSSLSDVQDSSVGSLTKDYDDSFFDASEMSRMQRLQESFRQGAHAVKRGLHTAASQVAQTIPVHNALKAFSFNPRFMGALLGHFTHQSVSVGVSSLVQSLINETMFAALRHLPQRDLVGLQVLSGTTQLLLNRLRQYREQRSPERAAQGFHNLNDEEWAQLTREEKNAKMDEQRRGSDIVTMYAVASIATNLSLGANGEALGNKDLAAKFLAQDISVAVNATIRDTIQALFNMVSSDAPKRGLGGISGGKMYVAANLYGASLLAGNVASNALMPKGVSEARNAIADLPSSLAFSQASRILAQNAAINALINVLVETEDWTTNFEQSVQSGGVEQYLKPSIGATYPDLMRVFDQSIARIAVINSFASMGMAMSVLGNKMGLPSNVVSALSNAAPPLAIPLQYRSVAGTWQADAAVRDVADRQLNEVPEESVRSRV